MAIEVTSVARKKQTLSKAAAAVFVITQDDIRRSGATSIPDALRLAPGLFVAQIDSSKWAISARGGAGRFANKMLVLIDGRSVYTSLYSGVWWDQTDVLLEDVDRIEVIRGPGGTMWGANAVNGVINIITKSSRQTQGLMASATTGTQDRGIGSLRYGGKAGDNLSYRLYSKYLNRGKQFAPGAPSYDDWSSQRAGARLDWDLTPADSISFHADAYHGRSGQQVYATFPFPDPSRLIADNAGNSGGYAMGRWTRTYSERSEIAVQAYLSQENRNEAMSGIHGTTVDIDFQHRLGLGARNDALWGVAFRSVRDSLTSGLIRQQPIFDPASRTDALYSAFLQDDVNLIPQKLILTLGAKFQHNGYTGFNAQPNVRLLWAPSTRHTYWAAVSDAVRTPSRRDSDLTLPFALPPPAPAYLTGLLRGNPAFRNERVRAYELGGRWQPNARISFDVAGYVNTYRDLQSFRQLDLVFLYPPQFGAILPFTFVNGPKQTTKGLEVSANFKARRNLSLLLNYTRYSGQAPASATSALGALLSYTQFPGNQGQARVSWDFRPRTTLDVTAYAISRLNEAGVPGHLRTDLRLAYRASDNAEWSAGIQNMFRAHHPEFFALDYIRTLEARRALFVRFVWGR